jgi:hypothetical protein
MPFDPNALIEAISNGLPKVPSALIAAALLGGPTAIWLIVRFTRPPDVLKKVVEVPEALLWLCTSCRSMNEDRVDRCYRCHLPREVDDIPVVVHVGREAASRIGIQVGPSATARAPHYGWLGGEFIVPEPKTNEPVEPDVLVAPADFVAVVEPPTEQTIAPPIEPSTVLPIAPAIEQPVEPVILEPKVKVSGRKSAAKSAAGPARPRGRRKPQGAGEANSKPNTRSPGS